jgi:hypothetical protein
MMKKPYEPPRILMTEKLTLRAAACARADDSCRVNGGPIDS